MRCCSIKQNPAASRRSSRRGLMALSFIGLLVLPTLAQANAYVLNKDQSKILFSIGHFYVSSTDGQFTAFDGKLNFEAEAPEHGTATIHISPASISTGIAARDDHLRTADFFDAAKFPVATFESTSLDRVTGKSGKMIGTLSLHGVTRPVTLNVTLLTPDLNADRLNFSASTTLKRSDYGMNNYMGVIGDEVTLTIQAEFDREK
jgi:polyisoprenoid-binding protein YceI